MNWIEEIDKIQLADGDGTFGQHGIPGQPNRKYVSPSEIWYDAEGIIIRNRRFSVKNPRLEFAKLLDAQWPHRWKEVIQHNSSTIGENCSIGYAGFGYERLEDGTLFAMPHLGRVVIEENVTIHNNVCIDRGVIGDTVIGAGTKIDNLVHIAHGVKIGKNCLIAAGAVIGGSCEIGDNCNIWVHASIKNKVKIGSGVTVGMGAVVLKDVPDGATVVGNPARIL